MNVEVLLAIQTDGFSEKRIKMAKISLTWKTIIAILIESLLRLIWINVAAYLPLKALVATTNVILSRFKVYFCSKLYLLQQPCKTFVKLIERICDNNLWNFIWVSNGTQFLKKFHPWTVKRVKLFYSVMIVDWWMYHIILFKYQCSIYFQKKKLILQLLA